MKGKIDCGLFEIDMSELFEVRDNIKRIKEKDIRNTEKLMLENMRDAFIFDVMPKTPIVTGNLREHWLRDNAKPLAPLLILGYLSAEVINTCEYAMNVEMGKIEARNVTFTPRHFQLKTELEGNDNPGKYGGWVGEEEIVKLLGVKYFDHKR